MNRYCAFVDPSGGSSDSMTLGIAHAELTGEAVLDLVEEKRAPFDPSVVTEEFAEILDAYRITQVVGDRYSGEWVREAFRQNGFAYTPSERNKSAIYLEFLVLTNSGRARIPAIPRLRQQLVGLERRTSRSGRDSVDHRPGQHDDLANAAAGALVLAAEQAIVREPLVTFISFDESDSAETEWERRCFRSPRGFGGS
jgi:hypothetical protein